MQTLTRLWASAPPTARGILFMVFSTLAFTLSHGFIRYIAPEIHGLQVSFIHNIVGLALFTPWFLRHGLSGMRTERFSLHLTRSAFNAGAMLTFFTALSITPLAKVTALFFTSPIFAALLAVIALGERMRGRRWSALFFGFAGTLIILRPGIVELDLGTVLVLISAFCWACAMVIMRKLGTTESSFTQIAYTSLLMAIYSAPPAIYVWVWPAPQTWLILLVIAMLGTVAQLAVAQGLREAEASVIAPFDFLKLVWISLIAWFAFGEGADIFIWGGAAIVIASTSYLAYRESRANKGD